MSYGLNEIPIQNAQFLLWSLIQKLPRRNGPAEITKGLDAEKGEPQAGNAEALGSRKVSTLLAFSFINWSFVDFIVLSQFCRV